MNYFEYAAEKLEKEKSKPVKKEVRPLPPAEEVAVIESTLSDTRIDRIRAEWARR